MIVIAVDLRSPKIGGGWHTNYWRGPKDPATWGPLAGAGRFESVDEAIAALEAHVEPRRAAACRTEIMP